MKYTKLTPKSLPHKSIKVSKLLIPVLAGASLLGLTGTASVTPNVSANTTHKVKANQPFNMTQLKQFTGVTQSITRIDQNNGEVAPWEGSYVANHDGANISYYLESSSTATQTAWQRAIDNWNQLGVIHLYPVSSPDAATIKLTDTGMNDAINQQINSQGDDSVAGTTQIRSDGTASAELITKSFQDNSMSTFRRSDAWEMQESYDKYTGLDDTATHELGHALGFAHDDDTRSDVKVQATIYDSKYNKRTHHWVMKPHNTTYVQPKVEQVMRSGLVFSSEMTQVAPLGQPQINALREHYGL